MLQSSTVAESSNGWMMMLQSSTVTESSNGWMMAQLYLWWLQQIYKPMTSSTLCHHLLLVDNYRPHLTEESQEVVHECIINLGEI